MDRCVLDTSVIIKSIFKPPKSLTSEIYGRELETHKKCITIIRMLEEWEIDVYVPKACVVEIAAVVRRLAGKNVAMKISREVLYSYEVLDEMFLFDSAWTIAINTGCSGFDSYFIALARINDAVLLTDDKGMHFHAKEVDVDSVLIRETDLKNISMRGHSL
jgi:predicted nucleic acid-binding protein